MFDIPVVLFVFRRLDTVKLIFSELEKIKPEKLYIFSDGPRDGKDDEAKMVDDVRSYINRAVNWDCEYIPVFSQENKGCAENIISGINTVFKKEKYAIIFEDDAVPVEEYFSYCEELLKEYENDKRIQYIAGFNAIGENEIIKEDYAFAKDAPMSGAIAMWADRWNECDFKMTSWPKRKKDKSLRKYYYNHEIYSYTVKAYDDSWKNINAGWDYQFHYDQLDKERFAIVPKNNLVTSYGFVDGAFHPQSSHTAKTLINYMSANDKRVSKPLQKPAKIVWCREYDKRRQQLYLKATGTYINRHVHYVYIAVKDFAYKHLPKKIWNLLKGNK